LLTRNTTCPPLCEIDQRPQIVGVEAPWHVVEVDATTPRQDDVPAISQIDVVKVLVAIGPKSETSIDKRQAIEGNDGKLRDARQWACDVGNSDELSAYPTAWPATLFGQQFPPDSQQIIV